MLQIQTYRLQTASKLTGVLRRNKYEIYLDRARKWADPLSSYEWRSKNLTLQSRDKQPLKVMKSLDLWLGIWFMHLKKKKRKKERINWEEVATQSNSVSVMLHKKEQVGEEIEKWCYCNVCVSEAECETVPLSPDEIFLCVCVCVREKSTWSFEILTGGSTGLLIPTIFNMTAILGPPVSHFYKPSHSVLLVRHLNSVYMVYLYILSKLFIKSWNLFLFFFSRIVGKMCLYTVIYHFLWFSGEM